MLFTAEIVRGHILLCTSSDRRCTFVLTNGDRTRTLLYYHTNTVGADNIL
jgi:hypothetical protein